MTELDGATPLATPAYQYGYAPADLANAYAWDDPAGGDLDGQRRDDRDRRRVRQPERLRRPDGLPQHVRAAAVHDRVGLLREGEPERRASPLPSPNVGWGQEIDLDIEMASAVCPQCSILLVEANSTSIADLGTAVNRAAAMGAAAISNSYGTSGE